MMLLQACHKVNLYGFNTAETLAQLGEEAMEVRWQSVRSHTTLLLLCRRSQSHDCCDRSDSLAVMSRPDASAPQPTPP